jgi:DNA polymerase-3 subunit beta
MSAISFAFDIRALKATAIAAGNEATRYYLNGVNIEHTLSGPIFVATDGHRLIATRQDWAEATPAYFAPVVVPLTLIKRIKVARKADDATMTIETKPDGGISVSIYYAGATYAENAIAATFPSWRQVMPRSCDNTPAQYNPAYLADFAEAGRILNGGKCDRAVAVSYNGGNPALVRFWYDYRPVQSFGVLMPARTDPVMDAPPAWTGFVKPETVAAD